MYNIVFMGTPEFAVPTLKALFNSEICSLKAIYTQEDKPVGRKQTLTSPPVKIFAEKHSIPIFQPQKLRNNLEVEAHLKSLDLDFIIVVAYGKILPKNILNIPKKGCINVHASLLEKYRGAAPIQWSIANGDNTTGLTTMLMNEGLDTGDILLQRTLDIFIDDTTETLGKNLSILGSNLLLETLNNFDKIKPQKQDDSKASYAPIIKKEDGKIDWSKPAFEIYNLVRAFNPWPIVYTSYEDKKLQILECDLLLGDDEENKDLKHGQVSNINKSGIVICTGKGSLLVTKVKLSGSKEMSSMDFARGRRLEVNYIFSS